MTVCHEARLPRPVRAERALKLAAEELGVAELDNVITLASEICRLRIFPDFALEFFESEAMDFDITKSNGTYLIRRRQFRPVSGV